MRQQHGLISFRQAVEAGLPAVQINRLVRTGQWTRVCSGVYTDTDTWGGLDRWVGQPALRARATHLLVRVPHWFSHDSAAALHGMGLLDRATERVHLTRPDMRGRQVRRGFTQHGARVHAAETTILDGLPALSVARTALDVVREHGLTVGLGACDHALRTGTSRGELAEVADRMTGWPYSLAVRDAVALADKGADNVAESGARSLVHELGIGHPETQFGLTDGRRTVWCDIRVGRHIFEFDGKVKYTPVQEGGYAGDPKRALWEEKRRQDFVTGFKLGISRITYVDLFAGREDARRRLTREYDATVALFGSSIADLAPYIVQRPS